jgi:hypothetical protein
MSAANSHGAAGGLITRVFGRHAGLLCDLPLCLVVMVFVIRRPRSPAFWRDDCRPHALVRRL